MTWLARDDFDVTGADDAASDGVVDALRAIEGVELAALVREPRDRSGPARKVSLRSRAGGLDCSAIARERGGGGHPGAAGFSTDESVEEIVAFLERAAARVNAAVLLVDKPAGPTSFGCVARVRGALGAAG